MGDNVARSNPRLSSRGVIDRRHHLDKPVLQRDLNITERKPREEERDPTIAPRIDESLKLFPGRISNWPSASSRGPVTLYLMSSIAAYRLPP
jgi:hypothetical protein